ncbi:MAG: type I-E CRISPR-associated protein Cse2/CasB [Phycisphaerae bacterium]|nr:type I-E CRISPR-associated protein Cse2/CasB [Phycisphaerae bacterium]
MSQSITFIERLQNLKEGERSRLRSLAGRPLDACLQGFDLFTGLWWPLRNESPSVPRREPSWLVAKLYGACCVPHRSVEQGPGASLPGVLGMCEPPRPHCRVGALLSSRPPDQEPAKSEFIAARKFRRRFDALLCSTLASVEPHLWWVLGEVARAVEGRVAHARGAQGIDWALLLDDLSLWDREFNLDDTRQKHRLKTHEQLVHCREAHRTPQDLWACEYLYAANHQLQGDRHAD